jgi:hemerythrin-like domain-containing protein
MKFKVLMKSYSLFLCLSLPVLALAQDTQSKSTSIGVEMVSPTEDLMREHGVLDRILLIYEEIIKRMDADQPFSPNSLKRSAEIVRSFIENYHEKLEEEYLFTKFEKAKKMLDLVTTLREQHQQGRILTDYILVHANETDKKLKTILQEFIAMYRPHAAREDTVLFPAFKMLLSEEEYDALGDIFEKKEHELFGKDGFNSIVRDIEDIEKGLGIYNLSQFTPKIK